MTEANWMSQASAPLLDFVRSHTNARKARLFACGWVRRRWTELEGLEHCRSAVLIAERFADGLASPEELRRACQAAYEDHCRHFGPELGLIGIDAVLAAEEDPWEFAKNLYSQSTEYYSVVPLVADLREQQALKEWIEAWHARCVSLVHDIYGNPFQPVAINPAWLSSDVISVTQGIYEDRAFGRMSILGDALEEAGCDNADILVHCRSRAEHVRGCWVLDAILGKS
jgi:hypothetical protein